MVTEDVVSKPASARKVKFQEETEPQLEGIARKVVNIDGTRYLPRRGKFAAVSSDCGAQTLGKRKNEFRVWSQELLFGMVTEDVVSKPASARKVKFQEETEPQLEGIARKVVNIDGTRYLPRRGRFSVVD
ncbi:hypothetical protein QVD17_07171 [Tagetes erecta]|uniref:Uncharacterized protein n=1 Tax=Tagetes erecta TaxID=13708 RepID=A0AAD8LIC5_TARER|nr:hypothetical protein QVD17_07171 [Tagetes erecta]